MQEQWIEMDLTDVVEQIEQLVAIENAMSNFWGFMNFRGIVEFQSDGPEAS